MFKERLSFNLINFIITNIFAYFILFLFMNLLIVFKKYLYIYIYIYNIYAYMRRPYLHAYVLAYICILLLKCEGLEIIFEI